jgi:hypothetical protein
MLNSQPHRTKGIAIALDVTIFITVNTISLVTLLTSNLDAQQTASENKGSCLALPLGVTMVAL